MQNVLQFTGNQEPFYRTIDDYPMILQARHVKEILGVSEAFAY